MKFCLTSISSESFTSAKRFMDSPASSSASPASRERKGGGREEEEEGKRQGRGREKGPAS